eukprot:CAMPEP_0194078278 /NCGR_PEP_ID=MMETSP0149-20130528/4708_1 /TAXON_ID=122233 /ORGANISM="Chaetoceros debilis, Strain MM31A-1" /LENGTH=536 /DNA_ID=CAMNT_0038759511 /DNA_START=95 /DNA_END=1705 /DNA_ORIENTATION=-
MASSFDPFAASADPFASNPGPGVAAPTAAAPAEAHYGQNQQTESQQMHQSSNPFAVYAGGVGGAGGLQNAPASPPNQYQMPSANSMVPVAPQQQQNQWSVQQQPQQQQQQQQQPQQPSSYNQNSYQSPSGYQQHPHVIGYQQQVNVAAQQQIPQNRMVVPPNQAVGYAAVNSPPVQSPQPFVQPPAPAAAALTHVVSAPVVTEDNDFFGDFSNNTVSKSNESPNRPPSVFEATQNDDVSYLSKSTNGGLSERQPMNGKSPLDDPKFAPKPPPIQGLANAAALSREAPHTAAPLPDFDLVTHSGYSLARISFRTILIKKWKQVFWVTYGASKVLFFRSSTDFEDWVSNPYLSQVQRDFLVKLQVDFVADCGRQSVRGYQVTNQRLKNYNSRMLHQFKLERWMDYGPTIAAAFASPNEREVYNLRTVFTEIMKRAPSASKQRAQNLQNHYAAARNRSNMTAGGDMYGNPVQSMPEQQVYQYPSSASAGGRFQNGNASVYSGRSHQSQGVMSTGPVERRRDAAEDEYIGGYRIVSRTHY